MSNYKVVLVSNINFLFYCVICKGYLATNYGIQARIFTVNEKSSQDDLIFEKDEIVIPFTFEGMKLCYGLENCIVMHPRQTKFLNDKQSSGEFIDILKIPNIPTFYNHKYNNSQDLKNYLDQFSQDATFCIKGRNTSASRDIVFIGSKELINKYSNDRNSFDDYIIQLYIETDYLLSIDCMCHKGKIKGFLVNKSPLFFTREDKFIKNRFKKFTHDMINERSNNPFYNRLVTQSEKIIKSVNYDGFIEIEWLCRETDNKLLFLEINPRMSGNLNYSNYGRFVDFSLPYIDVLLINYISTVGEIKAKNCLLKNQIPVKFPKKVTKGSYNLVLRPFLILLCLVILIVLINIFVKENK